MNKIIYPLLILLFAANFLWAQEDPPHLNERMRRGRLAELEKIKLIETLQMDEETTLRFFARRSEHMQNQKELMNSRRELLQEMEKQFKNEEKLSDEEYEANLMSLIQSEKVMLENRTKFVESLKDILSAEQIAKLAVFEYTFMKEIRKVMRKGRGRSEY